MGKKRKRSKSPERLRKKLKKLQQKLQKYDTRGRYSESSTSDDSDSYHHERYYGNITDVMEIPDEDHVVSTEKEQPPPEVESVPELDSVVLQILGDDPTKKTLVGEILHKDVESRWTYFLLNGLEKDYKVDLTKLYVPSENCPSMAAPKLNPEIKAALTEPDQKRDLYSQSKQNQLGSCLAAVAKALNWALCVNTNEIQENIIKPLSDAGRLLCDSHYKESQSRRYAIINTLNRQTREAIRNTKVDGLLFGKDLAEYLKSSKAINRAGAELKSIHRPYKPPLIPTTPINNNQSSIQRGALNSRGRGRGAATGNRPNPVPPRPAAGPATHRRRDNYRDTSNRRNHRTNQHSRY